MGSGLSRSSKGLSKDVLLVHVPAPPDNAWMAKMEAKHPGLQVRWHQHPMPGTIEFSKTEPLPRETYQGVTLLCSLAPTHPAELLPNVRFIQIPMAGADLWTKHPFYRARGVTMCTANGTHPYGVPFHPLSATPFPPKETNKPPQNKAI